MAAPRIRRHILVPNQPATEAFTPHRKGFAQTDFARPQDRKAHAAGLTAALNAASVEAFGKRGQIAPALAPAISQAGIYIEFVAPAGVELKLESLDLASGIRLLAVREEKGNGTETQTATVFVPDGKLTHFLSRFAQYANEKTKTDQPKHKDLVDRIATVRLATLRALWTDDPDRFPPQHELVWWEVWLRRSVGELERLAAFCAGSNISLGSRQLAFDDRVVCLVRATPEQLAASLVVLGDMAELRRAKTAAGFFAGQGAIEQVAWSADLLARVTPPDAGAPSVCILDTGVNRSHPLIAPSLAVADATAVEVAWGPGDDGGGPEQAGHGTAMAGLALFGDMAPVLESTGAVELRHCLESVKILPPTGQNDPDLYGAVTAVAVSRPEIQEPERNRVFSMAVTAPSEDDSGQPTSWSAAIDALAAGRSFDQEDGDLVYLDAHAESDAQRLFVVSAGNVHPSHFQVNHVDRSDVSLVQDPAQAWNVLTVGAFTEKAVIVDDALATWTVVAKPGDLSPHSTTSCAFDSAWPNKPEVVFEGGNVGHDGAGGFHEGIPDLCLLATYFKPFEKQFVISNATSAAGAQAARMAAMLAVEYPTLWPETRRALIVHSARWTSRMQAAIDGAPGKTAIGSLVRRYGYGVPDLSRAVRSANDALTLVLEATIHPYAKGKMREMHVHSLPWPKDVLAELHAANVRLRVTLSYFIEPNPARLGWKRRHRYASHALRFDVKTANESIAEFRKRLNKRALDEDEGKPTTGSDSVEWLLGDRTRHRGSLHCDIWQGTAADLAERGVIGIYPVSGWWKDQPKRDRSNAGARYALIVSIETDAEDVDIWTPVAQQVGVPIEIDGD